MASHDRRTAGSPLRVVLEIDDDDTFRQLMGLVSDASLAVDTKDIRSAHRSAESSTTVDLSVLTEKQREAVELALREGYYERPREADLAALAGTLDISKSAVSQRLRTAERKLIKSTLGQDA